jgi:copper(I)-binding protein
MHQWMTDSGLTPHVLVDAGITGVDVPARAVVVLAPQGTHLMLMGLTQPLVAGERIPLTLQFAQAGKRPINVDGRPPGESPATPH